MNSRSTISIVLVSVLAFAAWPDVVLGQWDAAEVAELQELCRAAQRDVAALIDAGQLEQAESLVERFEPKFEGRWGISAFGFGTQMQIGDAYLARGDKDDAFRAYRAARPGGGCGNCMASQSIQRNFAIARIYESRWNYPAAFLTYLASLPSTLLGGHFSAVVLGLSNSGLVTLLPVYLVYRGVRVWRRRAAKSSDAAPPA